MLMMLMLLLLWLLQLYTLLAARLRQHRAPVGDSRLYQTPREKRGQTLGASRSNKPADDVMAACHQDLI